MEVLDQYFGSVCELDLVFNFHKVYQILDEMVIGGEVMETSKPTINRALKHTDYYDWATKQIPFVYFYATFVLLIYYFTHW